LEHKADIIVVGAGMVGATLAALLGQAGWRIILVNDTDRNPAPAKGDPPDLRVSSVNRGSSIVFERAGAWPAMMGQRACPFQRVRVWDTSGIEAGFHASETGHDCLGWFIENGVIVSALLDRIAELDAVTWLAPAQLTRIDTDATSARAYLADGTSLRAELLVGADGPDSFVRHAVGIGCHQTDYGQRALVTNAHTSLPQQDVSWQVFTPTGPRAFLPLAGPHASLIWYDEPDPIREREALADGDLMAAIQDAFPNELGGLEGIHARASFPIRRRHAHTYRADRAVLIGDAAHVIHPLMGQGLNLGILAVNSLARAITHSHRNDPGDPTTLAAYERAHRPQALALMAATQGCHRLFTRRGGLAPWLGRGLLALASRLPPARRQAMRLAMGVDTGVH